MIKFLKKILHIKKKDEEIDGEMKKKVGKEVPVDPPVEEEK